MESKDCFKKETALAFAFIWDNSIIEKRMFLLIAHGGGMNESD